MNLSFGGILFHPKWCLSSYWQPLVISGSQSPPFLLHSISHLISATASSSIWWCYGGERSHIRTLLGALSWGNHLPSNSSLTTSQSDHGPFNSMLCTSSSNLFPSWSTYGRYVAPFGECAHPTLCPSPSSDAQVLTTLCQGE